MPRLSLASFNSHAGMDGWGRPYDLRDACRRLDADVIVLQETFAPLDAPSQAHELAADLGYTPVELPLARAWRREEGIWHGTGWEPRKVLSTTLRAIRVGGHVDYSRRRDFEGYEEGTWGIAVLARPEVEATKVLQLRALSRDYTARCALAVTLNVDAGGAPFRLVATHIAHMTAGSPLQIRDLHRQVSEDPEPTAIAGDMNVWGPPLRLLMPGWRRAVRGRTWPAWRPHSQPDHILVNRAVTILAGEVVYAGNSDHRAVRTELAW